MSHVDSLIDDYVLDLVSAEERRAVDQHTADCACCMKLLAQERARTGRLISDLRDASSPPAGRLEALWPSVAVAAGIALRQRKARPRASWWVQWRAAFATFAVAFLLLAGLFGVFERFDGWWMGTFTPTATSQSASPTASLTPTWAQSSHSQDSVALLGGGIALTTVTPTVYGTPSPMLGEYSPQPQPNPSAPPAGKP